MMFARWNATVFRAECPMSAPGHERRPAPPPAQSMSALAQDRSAATARKVGRTFAASRFSASRCSIGSMPRTSRRLHSSHFSRARESLTSGKRRARCSAVCRRAQPGTIGAAPGHVASRLDGHEQAAAVAQAVRVVARLGPSQGGVRQLVVCCHLPDLLQHHLQHRTAMIMEAY